MPVNRNGVNHPPKLIYRSAAMGEVESLINELAASDCPVLIRGESGSGKEVVASLLHARSPRASAPYGKTNCAAIPEANLETELFGVARRAFSQVDEREGLLEATNGGSLFLDEIGEMPLSIQAKFLNAVEGEPFSRVGSTRAISANIRFIYATNRDLLGAVNEGVFREDLYHRIGGMQIHIPPLREHPEDILSLLVHYLRIYSEKYKKPNLEIATEAMELFTRYSWPGNVRELQKTIEQLVVRARGPVLKAEQLPDYIQSNLPNLTRSSPSLRPPKPSDPPQRTRPPFPGDPHYERIHRTALVHAVLTNHLRGARVATLLQTHRGGGRTLARQIAPLCYGMTPVWLTTFSSEKSTPAEFYSLLTGNSTIRDQADFWSWLTSHMTERGVLVLLLGTQGPEELLEEVAAKIRSLLAGHQASAFLVVGGERLLRLRKHERYSWYRLLPASSFVDVPDLTEAEVSKLLEERQLPVARAAMLWQSTGGHPWLLYELVRKGISEPAPAIEAVKYQLSMTHRLKDRYLSEPQASGVLRKLLRGEDVASLSDPLVRHEPVSFVEARMYFDGLLTWDKSGKTQFRCPAVQLLCEQELLA